MEQPIIQPIAKELLKSELTPDKQLRMTNKSNNEIYIITAHNAPNVMQEIGRLREIAFREAGGGTGKEVDIDEFDICENCYKQLIVWNPEEEEIIGHLPLNWGVLSFHYLINHRVWAPRASLLWTTCGTDLEH